MKTRHVKNRQVKALIFKTRQVRPIELGLADLKTQRRCQMIDGLFHVVTKKENPVDVREPRKMLPPSRKEINKNSVKFLNSQYSVCSFDESLRGLDYAYLRTSRGIACRGSTPMDKSFKLSRDGNYSLLAIERASSTTSRSAQQMVPLKPRRATSQWPKRWHPFESLRATSQ